PLADADALTDADALADDDAAADDVTATADDAALDVGAPGMEASFASTFCTNCWMRTFAVSVTMPVRPNWAMGPASWTSASTSTRVPPAASDMRYAITSFDRLPPR